MEKKVIIEAKNLVKTYGDGEALMHALDNVSIEVYEHEFLVILGGSGSGKSTFLNMIGGIDKVDSGEILVNGKNIGVETKKVISYLPERTYLNKQMKVLEIINYFKDFYIDFDENKAKELLKKLDLDINEHLTKMSKGMQEKVQLVLVMSRKADLYILDEPLGGVDPATRDYILDTILSNFNENASVIISTHLISDIERILDEVIFIDKGRVILQSDADKLRNKEKSSIDEIFRRMFKC